MSIYQSATAMKKIHVILLMVICVVCATSAFAQKEFTIKGTMRYSLIEGGCWYIESHKKNYQLTGTEEQLATCRVEDRPLTLVVRLRNMQTVCMMGQVVEVIDIIDTVFHPHNPPVERFKITGKIYMLDDSCYYVKTKSGKKYEFQGTVPKKYRKPGAKYSAMSMVIPSVDGFHNMTGVIMLPTLTEPDTRNIPKKADPR
jgi:hypothetical protein